MDSKYKSILFDVVENTEDAIILRVSILIKERKFSYLYCEVKKEGETVATFKEIQKKALDEAKLFYGDCFEEHKDDNVVEVPSAEEPLNNSFDVKEMPEAAELDPDSDRPGVPYSNLQEPDNAKSQLIEQVKEKIIHLDLNPGEQIELLYENYKEENLDELGMDQLEDLLEKLTEIEEI